ncbi:shikimate O-hydroxycinnamoyltransferase [Ranunculus cassubicifolius]
MKISISKSSMIVPSEETPKCSIWTSNIDQLFEWHVLCLYVYKPDGSSNFFDVGVLKDGLSKVLVPLYPMAGTLNCNTHDRAEILCNGKGALFIEAETDSILEDFGDFAPGMDKLKHLVPTVDDPSSTPILMVQITRFRCGAVALVIASNHTVADGASVLHFTKSWCEVVCGSHISIPPFTDRTLLRARDPPNPIFSPMLKDHPPPTLKLPHETDELQSDQAKREIAMLRISRDQINALKDKCKDYTNSIAFTTYEVLVIHIWRCACKARRLLDDQETKLSIATDGNAIFHMTPISTSGDLISNPFLYTVRKIHGSIIQSNDEYLRSAIDSLEKHNIWCGLPLYDVDFGWGKPTYVGPVTIACEGLGIIFPNPTTKDGSVTLAISLHSGAMDCFKQYFYGLHQPHASPLVRSWDAHPGSPGSNQASCKKGKGSGYIPTVSNKRMGMGAQPPAHEPVQVSLTNKHPIGLESENKGSQALSGGVAHLKSICT